MTGVRHDRPGREMTGPGGEMSGRAAQARLGAAVAAAAALTALVFVTVHPSQVTARLGVLPLAAALWAVFAAGVLLVRRLPARQAVPVILLGAIAVQLAALSAAPQGSDDLYRYLWDGRVQAAGIDPYAYSPAAPQLASLRDPFLWPHHTTTWCVAPGTALYGSPAGLAVPGCTLINRPIVHTIYPPVAEAYFFAVHLAAPSGGGATPVQVAAACCALAVTVALLSGLARLDLDRRQAVLWAWCPTVALEAGNNAHVDVLAALFTAVALLVLARPGGLRRSLAGGTLLALAIWTKVTPVLVAPALAKRRWYALASAGLFVTVAVYLPHVLAAGSRVIGFLPGYLQQEGYRDGARFLLLGTLVPGKLSLYAAVAVLAVTGLLVAWRSDPDRPWRGAVVMTGAALAVTTPPFSWYAMLLVLLVAFDGRAEWLAFAVVKYVAVGNPLPGMQVRLSTSERTGYAAALAVVVAASLLRWRRTRVQPGASVVTVPDRPLNFSAPSASST
jgi:Glycosyltransferase family 87